MIDPEITAIDAAMVAQNKSRADLGRLLGLDSSQVSRTFAGKRRLQRHEHARVMEWLGLAAPAPSTGAEIVPLRGLIPLYGWGAGPTDAHLALNEDHLRGYTAQHPGQAHVKDAFALEVSTIRMSPRYEPGETVYMAPNRWPTRGQDCVWTNRRGEAFLARYLGRDEAGVRFAELNPARETVVELSDVEAVHAVVGRG